MANHKSSKKRIRQTLTKRAHNRLFHKTARNAVKALRTTTEKSAAEALLPKVTAMLDKLAKHNIVHKNKAANLKSSIQLHVNALYLRPREERSRTETEKPHRKRAAFSVSRPARRQATSGGFGFHTNRPCRSCLRQGRFSFRERFPAPPGLPRYFRPSITAAMREKTSSIVPVPLTEAYLPCAA